MPRTFAEDVADFAEAGCPAMEVWLTKLEEHLRQHTLADTRKLLDDRRIDAGGRLVPGRLAARRKASSGRSTTITSAAGSISVSSSASPRCWSSPTSCRRSKPSTWSVPSCRCGRRRNGPMASASGWRWSFAARTPSAPAWTRRLALVAQAEQPNVGVCLDVFHYYTGPEQARRPGSTDPGQPGLRAGGRPGRRAPRAGQRQRSRPARRRRLPPAPPILDKLQAIGYDGWVSLELMNPTLWRTPATQMLELRRGALAAPGWLIIR